MPSSRPRPQAFPFATLERTFAILTTEPRPLALDGTGIPGLPDRPIPLDELRARLLHPSTPYATRDAALEVLIERARAQGGGWTVGLAGVLLPGLRRAVAPLAVACPGKEADLEAESLAGLPPAVVVTAGYDVLRDEGAAYARRLADAGVPVEHRHFERQMHLFFTLVNVLPASLQAIDYVVAAAEHSLASAALSGDGRRSLHE